MSFPENYILPYWLKQEDK
uniref:Uncharacterized protein n=1 Tax=Rhizophora mucronata TaxID=61149 RepID=A0A2P2Q7C9_RHIMU